MQNENKTPSWYIIHTYSTYESKVEKSIRNLVENNGLQDMIFDVIVPEYEDIIEKEDGKKKIVQRKKFPGYVFIKMIYSDRIWYLVTQTNGVTGFVGPAGRPTPLTEVEIKRLGLEHVQAPVDLDFVKGESIKVVSGPLAGFDGVVECKTSDNKKIKVIISMFGRETPVELELDQVDKMKK